jgi:hypothetical protein
MVEILKPPSLTTQAGASENSLSDGIRERAKRRELKIQIGSNLLNAIA